MASTSPSTLAQRIAEHLTAEALLRVLGVPEHQTIAMGNTVKCLCPICGSQAFKTLFLNTERRTFACKFTKCPAHGGGDWVTLVALARGVTELEAVRQLIGELGIPIPEEEAADLGAELEARGLQALGAGDLAGARRLLEEAAAARGGDPGLDLDVLGKLAHCCWELNDHEAARRHYRTIIERNIAAGEVHTAILVLSDLIHVDHEWAPELHLRLGHLMREMGETEKALDHLLRAADGLRRLGAASLAAEAASAAAELQPDSVVVQRALVESAVAQGDWPTALAHLDAFLSAADTDSNRAAVLTVLERLDAEGLLDPPHRLRRATLCLEAGDRATAEALLAALVESAVEEREATSDEQRPTGCDVEVLIKTIRGLPERSPALDTGLLRLLIAAERWDEADALLGELVESRAARREPTSSDIESQTIRVAFAAIERHRPDDLALRRRHWEWLASHAPAGEAAAFGLEMLTALGVRSAEATPDSPSTELRSLAEAVATRIPELVPGDLTLHASAAALLWRVTRSPEHRQSWGALVQRARDAGDEGLAVTIGRRHLEETGFDLPVAMRVVAAADAAGRLAEVSEIAEQVLEAQRANGDWPGVEHSVRQLIAARGRGSGLLAQLAEALEAQGRREEAAALWREVAEDHLAAGRADAAAAIFRRLGDRPRLAHALEAAGDAAAAGALWLEIARQLPVASGQPPPGGDGAVATGDDQRATRDDESACRHALAEARRLLGETPELLEAELRFFEQVMDEEGATECALALAKHHESGGDAEGALRLLERCVAEFGASVGLRRAQAETLTRAGHTRAAARAWRLLLHQAWEQSDWATCESILDTLAALGPLDLDDAERRVELLWRQGRHAEAEQHLTQLIDLCLREGRWLQAVEILRRAADRAAEPLPLLRRLAETLHANGQRDEALATLERAIGLCLEARAESRESQAEPRGSRADEQQATSDDLETLVALFHQWTPTAVLPRLALWDRLADVWSPERLLDAHAAFARELHSAGDTQGALTVCDHGLALRPSARALLEVLADLHLARGDEEQAAQALRALSRQLREMGELARAVDAHRRLLTLACATPDDRATLAELLVAKGERTAALETLQSLADHHRAARNHRALIRVCERVLALQPDHLPAMNTLAEASAEIGDLATATRWWLELAQHHLDRNRRAPAERAYQQILDRTPDSVAALEGLLTLAQQQQNPRRVDEIARRLLELHARTRFEQAEALAHTVLAQHPDADDFARRWADLLWERGRREEALRMLEERAEALRAAGRTAAALDALDHLMVFAPDRLDIATQIGLLALEIGDTTRARRAWKEALAGHRALGDIDGEYTVLTHLHRLDPHDDDLTAALATAALNIGRPEEAIALLTELLTRQRLTGDAVAQTATLTRILAIDPDRPDDARALADLLALRGQTAQAADAMRQALALCRLHERWDDAADAARRVEELDPGDRAATQLRAEALARAGHTEDAIQTYAALATATQAEHDYLMAEIAWRAVLELAPAHTVAQENLAALLAAQGQTDEAVRLWSALAQTHRAAGDAEAERQVLLALTATQPENLDALRRLADLSLAMGDVDATWNAFRRLLTSAHEAGDEERLAALQRELLTASSEPRLRIELANFHLEAGRRDQALALFEEVARAAQRARASAKVRALCAQMLHIDPDHVPALEMLVEVLDPNAESTAETLRSVRHRLARAHTAAGAHAKALPHLQALCAEPGAPAETLLELAGAFQALGQRGEFERALAQAAQRAAERPDPAPFLAACERLLEGSPWPRLIRERMADLITRAGRVAQHSEMLLALAEECEREGDIIRAAEIHEALVAAQPDRSAPRARFVEFLIAHGQHTRAVHELLALAARHRAEGDPRREIQALERARELDADNVPVLHQLGEALFAQNARGRALEHLKRAAELAQRQNRPQVLAELLRRILEIDPGDVPTRRTLIDLLLARGHDDEAVAQALTLADQCVGKGFLDIAAHCYRTVVQLRPTHLVAWHGLIDTYLQFGAEEDLLPDYLAVARIYLGEGRPREAVQWFRRYLGLAPGDLAVRKEFIETYLEVGSELDLREEYQTMAELCRQAGRADEAEIWQRKAERLAQQTARPASGAHRTPSNSQRPANVAPRAPGLPGSPRGAVRPSRTAAGASRRAGGQPGGPPAGPGARPQRSRQDTSAPSPGSREHFERMLAQYQTHLENDPRNPKLHQQVGEILHHLGQRDEAYAHWIEASELLFKQQAWAECAGLCERLLAMNPHDPRVRERLNRSQVALAQMKEVDRAIEDLERGG